MQNQNISVIYHSNIHNWRVVEEASTDSLHNQPFLNTFCVTIYLIDWGQFDFKSVHMKQISNKQQKILPDPTFLQRRIACMIEWLLIQSIIN